MLFAVAASTAGRLVATAGGAAGHHQSIAQHSRQRTRRSLCQTKKIRVPPIFPTWRWKMATAMPENAGDAALFVDPTSVEEISAAINKMSRMMRPCAASFVRKAWPERRNFHGENRGEVAGANTASNSEREIIDDAGVSSAGPPVWKFVLWFPTTPRLRSSGTLFRCPARASADLSVCARPESRCAPNPAKFRGALRSCFVPLQLHRRSHLPAG